MLYIIDAEFLESKSHQGKVNKNMVAIVDLELVGLELIEYSSSKHVPLLSVGT